jgi:acyl dehydratase
LRTFVVGEVLAHERTFSHEDVLDFLRLSGDAGVHHATADASGRRLVHGLLTATIPTKLGGDLNYLAREMVFEFLRPVYTGELIRCEIRVDEVNEEPKRVRLAMSGICKNPQGEEVMSFRTRGIVRR